jgi:5-methylcytosine-specific restriction endonuclease McrA
MDNTIFYESGKKRKGQYLICPTCNNSFIGRLNNPKTYCSNKCAYVGKIKEVEVNCATCNKVVLLKPSRIKSSKSGLIFCNRKCKEKAQSLIGGIKEIQPSHYGSTKTNHRDIAFRILPKCCNRCGYNEHPEILEVHHIDEDNTNNIIENLEVLCPNCHTIHHKLNKGF